MKLVCKNKMATTHRLNLLFIILVSGFKLGHLSPINDIKGEIIK